MKKKKRRGGTLLLVLFLLAGVAMLAYPSFSDYWNSQRQARAIVNYTEIVAQMDDEQYREIWDTAIAYNEALSKTGMQWELNEEQKEVYEATLDIDGSGNMGYIEIPKINVRLPLYHGTDEQILQNSVGHIEGTSLPVGSAHSQGDMQTADFGSHCVLSGHRGLPSARLFSDLDQMAEGDIFMLTVLDQKLTYEVDQISVVEPTDVSNLVIEDGQDLCTLVTCTPYGINTHRMLVRGHRIENENRVNVQSSADGVKIDPVIVAPFIAVPILLLMFLWTMLAPQGNKRSRR